TLGKKIIQESILLIEEIGFDNFTFKKLGEKIASNESSIYRYFENKHKLLIYLSDWYWSWIEYRLVFSTNNITSPLDKLLKAVDIITEKIVDDAETVYVNEAILNKIIVLEFTKTFLTKEVDEENKEGFFMVYKRVVNRIVKMIEAVNPDYKFAKSLASSIVEGALHQHFLREHLKTITDSENTTPREFYTDLVSKILNPQR
ncbi:MAG: TetR/AcrR family transcriptional regulator, partial [Flavobacterium sp.]|nr:TetR/AcrR family transcriptional regulator [Flavobacterium sp.]